MSEYFANFDFDALMAHNENAFDFNFLDLPPSIGQDEGIAYADNATYDLHPAMDLGVGPALDFDFNAGFHLDPSLPPLPDATATTGQSMCSRQNQPQIMPSNEDTGTKTFSLSTQAPVSIAYKRTVKEDGVVCEICHKEFHCHYELKWTEGHDNTTRICGLLGCNSSFNQCKTLRTHRILPHAKAHVPVWNDSIIACAECNETFKHETEMIRHGREKKHSPYACSCGVKFARTDVLARHLKGFIKESAKYECSFCKRHRGKHAFRRRDHLVQHLQGYHKMDPEEINENSPPTSRLQSRQLLYCPHEDCAAHRDDDFKALPWKEQYEGRPFQKQSDYNKHMREIHGESSFSCPVGGCDRVNAKGYMREKDLIKHLADKHPDAPSYTYTPPKASKYGCAGCGKKLISHSGLKEHEIWNCKVLKNKRGLSSTAANAE